VAVASSTGSAVGSSAGASVGVASAAAGASAAVSVVAAGAAHAVKSKVKTNNSGATNFCNFITTTSFLTALVYKNMMGLHWL
jgi:hypothetical protein